MNIRTPVSRIKKLRNAVRKVGARWRNKVLGEQGTEMGTVKEGGREWRGSVESTRQMTNCD